MANDRILVIAQIVGIEPGQPVTEDQITLLVHTILDDVLNYAHHVNNSDKYNLETAMARLEHLVKESYELP